LATYYVRTDGHDTASGANNTSNATTGAWLTIAKAVSTVAAGDTVYIVGSAGNASSYPTSSLDYTYGSYSTPAAGTAASPVRWIGLTSMPTIGVSGLAFYNCAYQIFENLYFVATSNSAGTYGIIHGTALVLRDCVLNLNNQASQIGADLSSATRSVVIGCDIYGGTASPSLSSGSYGLLISNGVVSGCHIWNCRDAGIRVQSNPAALMDNLIHGCAAAGISDTAANSDYYFGVIARNTVHGNAGNGLELTGTSASTTRPVFNNLVTSNGGYGLTYSDGSAATNDARKTFCDYNDFHGNTSGSYQNVSAGANDLNVDPSYTNASTRDFTPTNAAAKAGFPSTFPGTPI
jgi:hypothetical protein